MDVKRWHLVILSVRNGWPIGGLHVEVYHGGKEFYWMLGLSFVVKRGLIGD